MNVLFTALISTAVVVAASAWPQFDRSYGTVAAYERKLTQNLATILLYKLWCGVVTGALSPERGSLRMAAVYLRNITWIIAIILSSLCVCYNLSLFQGICKE